MAEAESAMEEASIGGTLPDIEDFPQEQLTAMEKEMLGVYLTSNPLNEYTELIKKVQQLPVMKLRRRRTVQAVSAARFVTG